MLPAADMFIRQMEHLGRGFLQLGQLVSWREREGERRRGRGMEREKLQIYIA